MKLIKSVSLFMLVAALFASCAKSDKKDGNVDTDAGGTTADSVAVDSTRTKEVAANLETTTFKIDGMTCPMGCAATIEKKLAKMDGVGEAKVDYEKKTATVSFDPAKQTPEKFVETVEGIADGAYKVRDVKSSGDKAFYSVDQEKEKKKKAEKKTKSTTATTKETKKAGCDTEKKGGCCAGDAKKSCHGEKGGSM